MSLKSTFFASMLAAVSFSVSAAVPDYINEKANHIADNGADWSALRTKVASTLAGDTADIRVLHIGDSHIQAEFVTNHLRSLLQKRYGNAGRGLIAPLRLAGTNQPNDYTVTSADGGTWTQTRLLKCPWLNRPGFTGIAARPSKPTSVVWRALSPGHNIARATLFSSAGSKLVTPIVPSDSLVQKVAAGESIYGAVLENGRKGLLYSAIGNNGACFNDYLLIDGFPKASAMFDADLIVLSMGTNEGFSTMTDAQIARSVDDLVNGIRHYNPQAAMLILLPMECQKNRNHGYRPLSEYYDVNKRVAEAKDVIAARAKALGVPVWDFYTVAGGEGASARWLEDKLMNRDRIHLVKAGYELMGDLLYDALVEALEAK